MSFLCRFRHRWRYFVGTDYGNLSAAVVTVRRCRRRRCPLNGRIEVVSSTLALKGGRER
jgi:hypothetical protein